MIDLCLGHFVEQYGFQTGLANYILGVPLKGLCFGNYCKIDATRCAECVNWCPMFVEIVAPSIVLQNVENKLEKSGTVTALLYSIIFR